MNKKWVLLVGATSGIARPLAREFARHKYSVLLAARDAEELEIQAADLRVRYGAQVKVLSFSVEEGNDYRSFWQSTQDACDGDLHGIILCHGTMPAQEELQSDYASARDMIEANYSSYVALLNLAAEYFEARGRGFIAAIGSVAGDRGRAGNYIYGSTKAAVDVLMQGLRQRLAKKNVAVTTIKPGPIDTAMTFGLDKLPLLAAPERAASDIYRAIRRRQDIVYTPLPWKFIMTILKLVPERLWKRLSF
jgi:short-subunit dehydrogenase